MRKILAVVFVIASLATSAQKVKKIKFSELQNLIVEADHELTVFNFWATWCGPCIVEMPHFESADQDNQVKVYFVSVDFPSQIDKVEKFIAKKQLESEVLFLDETDANSYIKKISSDWSGAIPATLFVSDLGKTWFHEKSFTEESLNEVISEYLK